MAYNINGTALDNPTRGWSELRATEYRGGVSISRPSLVTPGRHGRVAGMPATHEVPALSITVGVPIGDVDTLRALMAGATTLGRTHGAGTATVEPLSVGAPVLVGSELAEITGIFELPGAFYRGGTLDWDTSHAGSADLDCFTAGTAPVGDFQMRVSGATNPVITGAPGVGSISYAGTLTAGQFLRVDALTGRAWITTSAVWTGGTPADPLKVRFGEGPGFLQLTPRLQSHGLPTTCTLLLVADSGSGTLAIRGKAAYLG